MMGTHLPSRGGQSTPSECCSRNGRACAAHHRMPHTPWPSSRLQGLHPKTDSWEGTGLLTVPRGSGVRASSWKKTRGLGVTSVTGFTGTLSGQRSRIQVPSPGLPPPGSQHGCIRAVPGAWHTTRVPKGEGYFSVSLGLLRKFY